MGVRAPARASGSSDVPAMIWARHVLIPRAMSKTVQIRNVPDAVYGRLEARAAGAGQTVPDFLLAETPTTGGSPARAETLARTGRP